jgi:hypothetical protein
MGSQTMLRNHSDAEEEVITINYIVLKIDCALAGFVYSIHMAKEKGSN